MLEVYWICLLSGVLLTVVSVLLGDMISHAVNGMLDFLSIDFLQPTVIASAVTVWGGTGILLTEYTGLGTGMACALSILIAVLAAAPVYFIVVRPAKRSEASIAHSIHDYPGRIGEVTVPLPADGYGEVMIRSKIGLSCEIAASFDHTVIEAGTRVVVVEVKEHTLYVSRLDG